MPVTDRTVPASPTSTRLRVATDGSALGNPGPGGWCWYVDESRWGAGGLKRTTNNIMELVAIREALAATDGPVEVVTDSQYAINCLTKWIHNWRRRNWTTAAGKPVKNRELIVEIDRLLQGRDVTFTWVRGHAGNQLNEAADVRARAAASSQR